MTFPYGYLISSSYIIFLQVLISCSKLIPFPVIFISINNPTIYLVAQGNSMSFPDCSFSFILLYLIHWQVLTQSISKTYQNPSISTTTTISGWPQSNPVWLPFYSCPPNIHSLQSSQNINKIILLPCLSVASQHTLIKSKLQTVALKVLNKLAFASPFYFNGITSLLAH